MFHFALLLICLMSCNSDSYRSNKQLEIDKEQIRNCFLSNVENYRLHHRYDLRNQKQDEKEIFIEKKEMAKDYYKRFPTAELDPANFFEPYASRFSLAEDRYIASPNPTSEELNIEVDTVIYSSDSLRFFAVLVVELNYQAIEGLEEKRSFNRRFDSKAIMGLRNETTNSLQIYPLTKHKVTGFETAESAASELRMLYFNHLKGKGSTGTVFEGMNFDHNVGDADFFEKSPYFKKHPSGLFYFQMYRHLGEDYKYNYLKCNE